MSLLFTPLTLGPNELPNRVVMSPMTRSRSPHNVPDALVATYYAQRAEAGLIVTEGTSPSPNGLGYPRIPGLFDDAQVRGWALTTKAVHDAGGKIFVQLMHTGRVSHPDNLPAGARVLAPSAIACTEQMYTDQSGAMQPLPVPVAMSAADIASTIEEYVRSCALAIEAGFDGVELHGANGYLIDQFLNTASNQRTDEWGGSVTNRTRFALEVARRAGRQIGAERVGIRLSPYGVFNGMRPDADTDALYIELARGLSTLGMAYVHIVDHSSMGAPPVKDSLKQEIHGAFGGKMILSGGYDRARAEQDLEAKKGDLVAFGRPFIANPKLVSKMKADAALRAPDPTTFYTPGPKGYTDYPVE
jgi:N-ethylmaleimide reductase